MILLLCYNVGRVCVWAISINETNFETLKHKNYENQIDESY